MILTLEVIGAHAAKLGSGSRRTFTSAGGILGRDRNSDWVLSHTKVSARHATISYTNGVFYIEDTSTNGVFINSPKNRLDRGRPYPLRSGDRIYIDPYEIRASISEDEDRDAASGPLSDWSDRGGADSHAHSAYEPQDQYPPQRYPQSVAPGRPTPRQSLEVAPGQEVDPLKLLDLGPAPTPGRKTPKAKDLEFNSPVDAHYKPPAVITPVPAPAPPSPPVSPAFVIPADYDPLKDDADDFSWATPAAVTPPPATISAPAEVTAPDDWPPAPEPVLPSPSPAPPTAAPVVVRATPAPTPLPETQPSVEPLQPPFRAVQAAQPDFTDLLEGAGLRGIPASADLARTFGEILRVVVTGVMDVLRSRQQIKDEFRMRMTQFRPADNNPLKFSANVEDALHNLLVKQNPAYLKPVEAFEDAFEDVRNHQLAMLAGMRVAFDSMLAQFHPDHLQSQFDRGLKAGWALGMTSRLRYWELYRDRHQEILKDPDTAFRKLFGEEFARAYEEQLQRLKAERHGRLDPSVKTPRPHDD